MAREPAPITAAAGSAANATGGGGGGPPGQQKKRERKPQRPTNPDSKNQKKKARKKAKVSCSCFTHQCQRLALLQSPCLSIYARNRINGANLVILSFVHTENSTSFMVLVLR